MKTIRNSSKNALFLVASFFMSMLAFAQEKGADIDIEVNKGGSKNWYTQPWVWIVGAAVFILLLVALLRSNSSKD